MACGETNLRLQLLMQRMALDWIALSSVETICYATGHVEQIEVGRSPFAGGAALAMVGRDGSLGLLTSNPHQQQASVLLETFPAFHWQEPSDDEEAYRIALQRLVRRLGAGGRVGYERRSFPYAAAEPIGAREWLPIDDELSRTRCIKTGAEIASLERSAQTAARGQEAALRQTRAGRSELAAFGAIRAAMEEFAGERLAVAGDYLSGVARTSKAAGWPTGRTILEGDPVICDLAPRVSGYWGDSCGSFAAGDPSPIFERLFKASQDALSTALDIIRPGLRIAELDRRLRSVVASHGFAYPHHSGHSIGTSVHEWPRIVPYETSSVEQDMVLMIEPSAYHPDGGGARLEWMVHVQADGCRPMAPFTHCVRS